MRRTALFALLPLFLLPRALGVPGQASRSKFRRRSASLEVIVTRAPEARDGGSSVGRLLIQNVSAKSVVAVSVNVGLAIFGDGSTGGRERSGKGYLLDKFDVSSEIRKTTRSAP
jgi:hypothetical protein